MNGPLRSTYRVLTGLVIATLLIAACTNDTNRNQGQSQGQPVPASG